MAEDSHLSKPTKDNESPPIPQHKRMALGEKGANGQSNPFGAAKASTTKTVANARCTY